MNNKKIINLIFTIIIASIVGVGAYFVYSSLTTNKMAPSAKEIIKEKKEKKYEDKNDNKKDINTYVNNFPTIRQEYGNSDIVGRLEIPNLNINSLVTRTSNNEFYLNYNLYRQYDQLGAPFFDYRNTDLNNNRQLNIYGHNTRNEKYFDKLPFINLEAYTDKNIFDNYKDIYLSIDERQIHYEVIAVKIVTNADYEHMKVIFYSDDDYLNHVTKLLKNTLYKEDNLFINSKDKLIVLQVCHYNPEGSYLLVIGKES